jgi:uncharacterized ferritin-like protein (DUF455 family)
MTLSTPSVFEKLKHLDASLELAWRGHLVIPTKIARDITVLPPQAHPDKQGLAQSCGQARLLHDLANIELQAMELALRTLSEFQSADEKFREDLKALVQSEAKHLALCIEGIQNLGFQWGDWPIHTVLWDAVSQDDSLLDRIFIVHRYLEGGGLDAGEILLKRLNGVAHSCVHPVVNTIVHEEIDHVKFGSDWYNYFCLQDGLDPLIDFKSRFEKLKPILPKRIEKTSYSFRKKAGFTETELQLIDQFKDSCRIHKN